MNIPAPPAPETEYTFFEGRYRLAARAEGGEFVLFRSTIRCVPKILFRCDHWPTMFNAGLAVGFLALHEHRANVGKISPVVQ